MSTATPKTLHIKLGAEGRSFRIGKAPFTAVTDPVAYCKLMGRMKGTLGIHERQTHNRKSNSGKSR